MDISKYDPNFRPAVIEGREILYRDIMLEPFVFEGLAWDKKRFFRLPPDMTSAEVNEGALSASVGRRKPSEILAELDLEKIRFAYDYSKTQHTLGEQKKIALEKELIALTSTADSPARVNAKLNEVTDELEENRLKYKAILMAYETLTEASENLRRQIKDLLEESAKLKMELSEAKREIFKLQQKR